MNARTILGRLEGLKKLCLSEASQAALYGENRTVQGLMAAHDEAHTLKLEIENFYKDQGR